MRIQDLFMEFQNRLVCKQEDLFKLVASDLFIYVYEERGMTKATASSKKISKAFVQLYSYDLIILAVHNCLMHIR